MSKTCVACGMPMNKSEDFACNDIERNYCRFCAREDGTMQSYDEKLASLTGFIVKTQGLAEGVAQRTAREMMAKLPAWKGQS